MKVTNRNPDLRLAGVVMFAVSGSAMFGRRWKGCSEALLKTFVHHSESAAADARRRGLLVHELESASLAERRERLKALRAGQKLDDDQVYARDVKQLAGDYQELAREIFTRISEIEKEVAAA